MTRRLEGVREPRDAGAGCRGGARDQVGRTRAMYRAGSFGHLFPRESGVIPQTMER
jgi:hypothetical protein